MKKKYVTKCNMNGLSDETIQAIMSDYMEGKGTTFCILRPVEVNEEEEEENVPVKVHSLGLFGRIRGKIRRLFFND